MPNKKQIRKYPIILLIIIYSTNILTYNQFPSIAKETESTQKDDTSSSEILETLKQNSLDYQRIQYELDQYILQYEEYDQLSKECEENIKTVEENIKETTDLKEENQNNSTNLQKIEKNLEEYNKQLKNLKIQYEDYQWQKEIYIFYKQQKEKIIIEKQENINYNFLTKYTLIPSI